MTYHTTGSQSRAHFAASALLIASIFLAAPAAALAHVGIPAAPTTSCGSIDSTDFTTHVSNQVNSRISGVSSTSAMNLFSTKGDSETVQGATSTPWVRNTSAWTNNGNDIDWTGVSAWNQPTDGYSSRVEKAGTLISPRHVALATHWHMPIGATLLFVTNTNQHVYRTLTGLQNVGSDITIGLLDSDVPDSVTYYPIIASTTLQALIKKYEPQTYDLPIVIFDQEKKAIIHSLNSVYTLGTSAYLGHTTYYGTSTKALLSESLVGGDSGSPAFMVVDDRPVLLFTHTTANSGSNLGNYISEINSAMTSLGGGYQVTEYNPSCFTQYTPNNIPVFTSGSAASSTKFRQASSTVIYTYAATDADVGQTISYSLTSLASVASSTLSLNPATYFTIGTTTGQLKQIADINNLDVGDSLALTVTATDNGTPAATKQITTTINVDHPRVVSATRRGSTVELQYSSQIATTTLSPASQFEIKVNGSTATVSSATTTGYLVKLTLSSPVSTGDTITVKYTPGLNKIRSTDGAFAPAINPPLTVSNSKAGQIDSTFNSDLFDIVVPTVGAKPVFRRVLHDDSTGKIYVAGSFNRVGGVPTAPVVRLNANGSLDSSFNTGAGFATTSVNMHLAYMYDMAMDANGKLLVLGDFSGYQGVSANKIVRINPDGSIDSSFNPGTGFGTSSGNPFALKILPSGKIVVAGNFSQYNGSSKTDMVMLNADGTLDGGFSFGTGANDDIYRIDIDSSGKILIAGSFTQVQSTARHNIARINSDGSLDTSFVTDPTLSDYVQTAYAMKVLADGTIFVGGGWPGATATLSGGYLNSNGSIKKIFDAGEEADVFTDVVQLSNGKVIPSFTVIVVGPDIYGGIGAFNLDGTVDATFNFNEVTFAAAGTSDFPIDITGDEAYIYGGNHRFASIGGVSVGRQIVRFFATTEQDVEAPAVTSVSSSDDGSTVSFGNTVHVQVAFSENVTVTGTPTLTLQIGSATTTASYASGSGTNILTFTYTVSSDDYTPDLRYESSQSLSLAGGTIADASSNAAVLTLPYPGSSGSLDYSSTVGVHGTSPEIFAASVDGSSLTVVFSEMIGTTTTPSISNFSVKKNGAAQSGLLQSILPNGKSVTFTLSSAVVSTDALTISYTDGPNPVTDVAGNSLESVTDFVVSNQTLAAAPGNGGNTPAPSVPSGSSSGGGSGGGGATPGIIYYNRPWEGQYLAAGSTTLSATALANLGAGLTIKEVQQFLNAKGFPVVLTGAGSPGKETDTFGVLTKAALTKYQKARGLAQTGMLDAATRLAIAKEKYANGVAVPNTGTPTTGANPAANNNLACALPASIALPKTAIKYGAKNLVADVKALENYLNKYEGYSLKVDGSYSIADRNAVIKWQEKYRAEILAPIGLTKGTGHVLAQSLKKINQLVMNAECKK